ncbi:MAG TPA: threonine synthase [Actinomycetota bacterium]|nr:threonine synthase [Actinomycetota bacterium]
MVTAHPTITSPAALQCRICGQQYPVEPLTICEECFGPLEPAYDLQSVDGMDFRKQAEAGPSTLWRYESLLPGGPGIERIDLGAGYTPLRRADNLAKAIGMTGTLWIKDDSVNPSNSFKDRVVSVATTMARAFGYEAISCASTGNLANATAAHAAKAGMPCYVFVPEDLERAKILATEAYGAKVVAVKGNYDEVNRLCSEVAEALPWAFINVNMRPYYAEGSKSLGFETAEQLGWRLPDHVVVPIASGALLTKIHRAFSELIAIGAVDEKPYRVSGAQPEGCRPVAQAFLDGAEEVTPVKPDTIARSLAIGAPADGYFALKVARGTGGHIEWCTEQEIREGIRLLASTEGVFTETAGGVTIANLKRMAEQGIVKPGEEVVAYVTGNGYKTIEALEGFLEPTFSVAPDLDEFLAVLDA